MRADNKGEGGTLSLMALAQGAMGRRSAAVFLLGVARRRAVLRRRHHHPGDFRAVGGRGPQARGAAIRALRHPDHAGHPGRRCSSSRATAPRKWRPPFGPIMLIWFVALAVLGASHIHEAPRVLNAFNPYFGLKFLFSHGMLSFIILGSVFLAVTGAEALYADMGHFGRRPIQVAWIVFVLPALILNYLGQGALTLSNPAAIEDPFFLLAPKWALLPLVILATLATVIASQATITGAFSLARQAIQLGLLPRFEIQHKSDKQEGQIFLPRVNRVLLIGVILLVLMFKTSSNLASAYGIAVTASLMVDTCLGFIVVWQLWRWNVWAAALLSALSSSSNSPSSRPTSSSCSTAAMCRC
jgi:KUP system potassium uptake protein